MIKATLPLETATIPAEEARQTGSENDGLDGCDLVKQLKFSNNSKECDSQISLYKGVLSQPDGLSHFERLLWLQKRRTEGLWVNCDDCGRWRYLAHIIDRYDLPDKWYCRMNKDRHFGNCTVPEVPIHLHEEEDLIHSRFTAGSIVWAHLPGWPWWPAMVDDCPDTEQYYWLDGFSDIPTQYNVVFFDRNDATRAWILNEKIESYAINRKMGERALQNKKYKKRLRAAIIQAEDALKLPISLRLSKYSFLARYKGKILSPTTISKQDIERYRKNLKRKFNVEFSNSDTDEMSPINEDRSGKSERAMISTPRKCTAIRPKKIFDLDSEDKVNKADDAKDNNVVVTDSPDHNETSKTGNETNSLIMHFNTTINTAGLVTDSTNNDASAISESLISNTRAEADSQLPEFTASQDSNDFVF